MPTPENAVRAVIRRMNAAWLDGRLDAVSACLAPGVVVVAPDGARVAGRAAVVDSFRAYLLAATTHRFEERGLWVDVIGSTAVARLRFRVQYETEGRVYDEEGEDLLVLAEAEGAWRIVWRTQRPG